MLKRTNFIDGITLLGFSLVLVTLAGTINIQPFFFGLVNEGWMKPTLGIGAIFCLLTGVAVLFDKGHWFFIE